MKFFNFQWKYLNFSESFNIHFLLAEIKQRKLRSNLYKVYSIVCSLQLNTYALAFSILHCWLYRCFILVAFSFYEAFQIWPQQFSSSYRLLLQPELCDCILCIAPICIVIDAVVIASYSGKWKENMQIKWVIYFDFSHSHWEELKVILASVLLSRFLNSLPPYFYCISLCWPRSIQILAIHFNV